MACEGCEKRRKLMSSFFLSAKIRIRNAWFRMIGVYYPIMSHHRMIKQIMEVGASQELRVRDFEIVTTKYLESLRDNNRYLQRRLNDTKHEINDQGAQIRELNDRITAGGL